MVSASRLALEDGARLVGQRQSVTSAGHLTEKINYYRVIFGSAKFGPIL